MDNYMRHIKTNKNWSGHKKAKNDNGRIRWNHFALFSFAKISSNASEIPRTNDDTNVHYSENIHKEDSQP